MTENYSRYPLSYKIRKVLRYVRLYGPSRTLIKVRSQYHMCSNGGPLTHTWRNSKSSQSDKKDVAIIGCGNFAYANIAYYCNKERHGCIRAVYDVVGGRAVSLCRTFGGLYAAVDPREILEDPAVRSVFVVSNHASHAEYAINAIEAGKRVHIEKPHVINHDQLDRLLAAVRRTGNRQLFLGFNRPRSKHFARVMAALSAETGPLMINWFVAGHAIQDGHWYFSQSEGGRILGNLCHWTDLTLRMVGLDRAFPAVVVPGSVSDSKSDFALTFNFADQSVASITFSAKGQTFEGVREYLNAHRGYTLISMRDFHETVIDRNASRTRYRSFFRDHGHRANIVHSLMSDETEAIRTIDLTAQLFLAAKEAIDEQRSVNVSGERTV